MKYELSYLYKTPYENSVPKWLFVCNGGVLRSQTAAVVCERVLGYNCRSCGVESYSLIPLTLNLLYWADCVVFMDSTIFARALDDFAGCAIEIDLDNPKFKVWNIADSFELMNPVLAKLIEDCLTK